jgi:protein-disulfide isomerase
MKWPVLALLVAGAAAAEPRSGDVIRVEHHAEDAMPTRGPVTAPVTVELFFTPSALSRQPLYGLVEKLQAAHPSRVRVIYRIVKGIGNARLHYAALEAYAEGRFDAFIAALSTSPRSGISDPQLLDLAKSVGMDPQQLAAVISNPPAAYDRVLELNQHRLRQKAKAAQPPVILINGKLPKSTANGKELEAEYLAAKDAADELLDRGADPRTLPEAFDATTAPDPLTLVVTAGNPDDTVDDVPSVPPLASPALDLRGMPSVGPADAQVTIAVLCSPRSVNCKSALRAANEAQAIYNDSVRIVWAPFFDVTREDAADLGFLADAALCAEKVGTSADDFDTPGSPGWRWVTKMIDQSDALRRRRMPAEEQLEKVSDLLHVDKAAFATCRAAQAGSAIHWIEAARHAGVRTSPSTVVGGRIYPSIVDTTVLQQLVGAELEPGDCPGCLRLDNYAPTWRRR